MHLSFPVIRENGSGIVTLEVFEEEGRLVCGVFHLEGWLMEPPKKWLRTMRGELNQLAGIARSAGCDELRLRGRDWSRVFPELEPIEGLPNGLRMRL